MLRNHPMNLNSRLFLILTLAFLAVSCSSVEVFKENTEIPIRKPYRSFVIVNKELEMQSFSDQLIDEMVKYELQKQLEAAGMVYDAKQPDLVIRYHSNEDLRQREIVNQMNPYPFWGYRIYDPWFFNPYSMNNRPRVSTSNYELLQVILDFIDPVQDKFLMTLTAVTEVTNPKNKPKRTLKSLKSATDTFIQQNQMTQ
ncbi:uncharacterized protein DUF4136 [Algoriphagus aquaeductus]|uniref:Uncharacterized protein DUF4136 n=2 Tax=Cyclobacteriaceae TaxID=563798 RepID=A0A326RRE2_9BACT|nr:uncharacterized protein DUF4136 [Algoriphagus aquaeductus]